MVMIDIDSRKVIDVLGFKDLEEVTKWLKEFPDLKYVSRDGSKTYKAAIEKYHSQIQQISDRFHIAKNLIEATTKHFQKINAKAEQAKTMYKKGKNTTKISIIAG